LISDSIFQPSEIRYNEYLYQGIKKLLFFSCLTIKIHQTYPPNTPDARNFNPSRKIQNNNIKKSNPWYCPLRKIGGALIVPPSIEPDIDWFYALKLEQQERNLTALAFGEHLSR
jgi:hypothetical protein